MNETFPTYADALAFSTLAQQIGWAQARAIIRLQRTATPTTLDQALERYIDTSIATPSTLDKYRRLWETFNHKPNLGVNP
ncbi:hypothetical protein [Trueperella sp. LYQ143]|uniref:hypothetical protein n=1 Tax=unclassified Trueperella TaxID=2630174 RepID=UPI0039837121